jgi:hypothetical protein
MPAKKQTKKTASPVKKLQTNKVVEEEIEETPEKECEHCLGAGKCTAGEPYDKGHHQVFGSKVILTSCPDCLEADGEHRNSKKLVACRICGGTGQVKHK